MPQVNVTINGKVYRMACDDGQEAHLEGLAERLNVTIDRLRQSFGEIGDQRLTVMAGADAGRRTLRGLSPAFAASRPSLPASTRPRPP